MESGITLYHTNTSGKLVSGDLFGDFIFFSSSVYSMSARSEYVFKVEIDEDRLIRASSLFYHEDAAKLVDLVASVADLLDVSIETAEALIEETESVFDHGGDGEDGWEIQRVTAECARILGYVGAIGEDEQGTCYMLDMTQIEAKRSNCNDSA